MAIFEGSRFLFSRTLQDAGGLRYLEDRKPYRYMPHADNRAHVVTQCDTLASLAGLYFASLPRACGFWWVIADFQPDPILDPLLPLHGSRTVIFVPSVRVLTDVILARPRGHR